MEEAGQGRGIDGESPAATKSTQEELVGATPREQTLTRCRLLWVNLQRYFQGDHWRGEGRHSGAAEAGQSPCGEADQCGGDTSNAPRGSAQVTSEGSSTRSGGARGEGSGTEGNADRFGNHQYRRFLSPWWWRGSRRN